MNKSFVAAAAAAVLASAPAFAIGNSGFDQGNANGWTRISNYGQLKAFKAKTVVIKDDAVTDPSDPNYLRYKEKLAPIQGQYFGLLTMRNGKTDLDTRQRDRTTFRFRTPGGQGVDTLDVFYARMFTADYLYSNFGYDDKLTISYRGSLGTFVDEIEADDLGAAPDSGWIGFAVPLGTKAITVTLVNVYDKSGSNTPRAALDYGVGAAPASLAVTATQVTAVPEPGTIAMMLAGMGAVGWVARRRRQAGAV